MERENDIAILDEMYDFEADFDYEEKEDGQYFIGLFICMKDIQLFNSGRILEEDTNKLFLGIAISAKLFFKYEYKYVQKYLYSTIRYSPHAKNYCFKTSIMKLNISQNGLSLVIIKTYWLKLIQRHWKNIIKKRKEIIEKMNKYKYLQLREIGKHERYKIPRLKGILSYYSNNLGIYMECH